MRSKFVVITEDSLTSFEMFGRSSSWLIEKPGSLKSSSKLGVSYTALGESIYLTHWWGYP